MALRQTGTPSSLGDHFVGGSTTYSGIPGRAHFVPVDEEHTPARCLTDRAPRQRAPAGRHAGGPPAMLVGGLARGRAESP
jgi:hypothetical protein